MNPGTYDIVIYKGSTKNVNIQWKSGDPASPVNITGYKARMQVRKRVGDSTVIDELTTENSRIEITSAVDGKLVLKFPASVSSVWNFCIGVYDLEVVSPDNTTVTRILQGNFEAVGEVTK